MSSNSPIIYTKHLRYPGPAFFRDQAPSIVSAANVDADTLTELALMGAHTSKPGGVQLVVEQKNMIKFLKYMPRIPFEELAWPSRTVELYLDYPRLPTILAGCFSSEDFENMGIKGVPTRDTATHILIQENESPVSIQAYYSPEDMNTMVRTHPDKLGNEDGGLSSREDTLMKLSATFVYRALELFNLGKFCSYGPLAKVPWRPHRRNRPHTLTRALSNDFDKEDGDVS